MIYFSSYKSNRSLTKIFIVSQFPDETLRSGELLNMIVAVIDSTQVKPDRNPVEVLLHLLRVDTLMLCVGVQLQELMCHVMMGNLVMFRKDSVLNILSKELSFIEAEVVSQTHQLI